MASKQVSPSTIPTKPLRRIALCMSGGGYRAATFQLGMMSYLHSKKFGKNGETLLTKVKAISTVSGGTIIGVYYAAMVQEKEPFEKIYSSFTDWLAKTDLVKRGLEKISNKGQWNYPHKRKNIINAFAELYDETLLDKRTMAVFNDLSESHLDFVCFNATEFTKGYRFRFQTGKNCRVFGCSDLSISKKHYQHFRLGDIMAASSGFSGGFEPISMPDDFIDPRSPVYKEIMAKHKGDRQPIGIMDGGIHDNQGISSIESYQDYKRVEPFDLILFSDVSSPYLEPFTYYEEKNGGIRDKTLSDLSKNITKRKWMVYLLMLLFVLIGIVLMVLSDFEPSTLFGAGLTVTIFGVLGLLISYMVNRMLRAKWRSAGMYLRQFIPDYFLDRLPTFDLKNTKLKHLEVLALDRINSLKLLLPDVFLKQVRRLHYNRIFNDPELTYRRSACLIKELTEVDFQKKLKNDYAFMRKYVKGFDGDSQEAIVGKKILAYTTNAASFGTTLWFSDDDHLDEKLKALIISGQVSCCQDMLIYLTKLIHSPENGFKDLDGDTKTELIRLHQDILQDWEKFKKKPEFLYDTLQKDR